MGSEILKRGTKTRKSIGSTKRATVLKERKFPHITWKHHDLPFALKYQGFSVAIFLLEAKSPLSD